MPQSHDANPATPNTSTDDGWKLATATVVSSTAEWEGVRYDGENRTAEFPRFNTIFEYEVDEACYRGEYSTGTQQEEGMQFDILYDPAKPSRNTLSTAPFPLWLRILLWGAAACFVWLANRYLPSD